MLPVLVTIRVIVPAVVCVLTLLIGAFKVPRMLIVVDPGTPGKTTLLAATDEIVELAPILMVTATALPPDPNENEFAWLVTPPAPEVVIKFVPESGPTIDTPNVADVMVDPITVRPEPETVPR